MDDTKYYCDCESEDISRFDENLETGVIGCCMCHKQAPIEYQDVCTCLDPEPYDSDYLDYVCFACNLDMPYNYEPD